MSTENKTIEKLQTIEKLINELVEMRHQIVELKASEMQRQMAAAALQALENKYKTLIENIPQKLFVKDRNSVYLSCSESLARDLKIKAEDIAGKTDFDFFPREIAEKYMAAEKRVMESGQPEEAQEDYCVNGQKMIVRMIRVPLRDEKGEVNGLLGTFWDITKEKEEEENIKKELGLKENKIQELSRQLSEVKDLLEKEITQRNLLETEFKKNKTYLEEVLRVRQEELQKTKDELERKGEDYRKLLEELQEKEKEYSQTKAQLEEKILTYTNELRQIQDQREEELAEQKKLKEELAQAQERIIILEKQAAESSAELNKLREELAKEISQLQDIRQDLEKEKEKSKALEIELTEKNKELASLKEDWQKEQDRRQAVEEALQKKEEELNRLLQESSLTSEIGRVMGSTLTLEEIYQGFSLFADKVKKLIPFDRLSTTIINPEDNTLQISYALGMELADWPVGEVKPLSGSSAEEVMRTKSSLLIQEENQEEARKRFPDLQNYLAAGFRSMLFVPLSFREEVVGVLSIFSTAKNAYHKEDLRIAEKLAAQMAGAIGKGQKILAQQKREEVLRISEQKFRTMVEKSPVAIWVSRQDKIIYANTKCQDILGYSSEELLTKNLSTLMHGLDKERVMGLCTKWEKGELPATSYICRFYHKDGQVKWLENKTAILPWEKEEAVIHFLNDITQRKNLEDSLRQTIEPFRKLVQAVEDIVAALKEETQE